MSDHNPQIRKPTDQELTNAITAAERRGAYLMVGALLELKQFRAERRDAERQIREAFDDSKAMPSMTTAELKHELEKDRKARSQV